jgi:hypothetical protein
VSYCGEKGKTTGYCVSKAAQEARGKALLLGKKCLRELAELNKVAIRIASLAEEIEVFSSSLRFFIFDTA